MPIMWLGHLLSDAFTKWEYLYQDGVIFKYYNLAVSVKRKGLYLKLPGICIWKDMTCVIIYQCQLLMPQ